VSKGLLLFLDATGLASWRGCLALSRPPWWCIACFRTNRGRDMSQAIVDPIELRRFAQNLKKFNTELEERLTSLRAQLHGLGATWRDQEHKKFVEDFEEHMKVIGRYVEVTNEHAPFLLRKADRIEEYLQQR
jgi:uncharacterized protein YukE